MHKTSSSAALVLLVISVSFVSVRGYTQVATSGSGSGSGSSAADNNEGPKIYKALNVDLIYPKIFNSSENVISTTQTPISVATVAPMGSLSAIYKAQQQVQQQIAATPPTIFVTPPNDAQLLAYASPMAMTANLGQPPAGEEEQRAEQHQQKQQQQRLQELQLLQLQQEHASTGRAVDFRPTYPFSQLITPLIKNRPSPTAAARPAAAYQRPLYVRPMTTSAEASSSSLSTSNIDKVVYPQAYRRRHPSRVEVDRFRGKAQISDRFTPGEAVASGLFTKHKHQHDHSHSQPPKGNSGGNGGRLTASSNVVQAYVPPKDLYSFPPNLHAKYPSPAEDPKAAVPSNSVSSYLAVPSGPLTNSAGYPLPTSGTTANGYKYAGPFNPAYLPPQAAATSPPMGASDAPKDGGGDGGNVGDTDDGNDDTIGVLPASAMDTDDADGGGGDDDTGGMPGTDMSSDDHHHEHDHDPPLIGYDSDKEYPTPPPGWLDDHPESAHDHPPDHDHHFNFHDHDHDHDHFPSFPSYSHHYPDIIYDDHDHHHHHVEPPPPPPMTTLAPAPEPPPEPRVKKYSYFYIGRKLWYIPLYFTIWFSFYVLWLIVKSIARHKVNLPNHYVARRSLPDYAEANAQEYINDLTVSVLAKIDSFQRKYVK